MEVKFSNISYIPCQTGLERHGNTIKQVSLGPIEGVLLDSPGVGLHLLHLSICLGTFEIGSLRDNIGFICLSSHTVFYSLTVFQLKQKVLSSLEIK